MLNFQSTLDRLAAKAKVLLDEKASSMNLEERDRKMKTILAMLQHNYPQEFESWLIEKEIQSRYLALESGVFQTLNQLELKYHINPFVNKVVLKGKTKGKTLGLRPIDVIVRQEFQIDSKDPHYYLILLFLTDGPRMEILLLHEALKEANFN